MHHPATTSSPQAHAGHKPRPCIPKTIFTPPGGRAQRPALLDWQQGSAPRRQPAAHALPHKTMNQASTPGRHATCWPQATYAARRTHAIINSHWLADYLTAQRPSFRAASCCSHSSTPRSPQRAHHPLSQRAHHARVRSPGRLSATLQPSHGAPTPVGAPIPGQSVAHPLRRGDFAPSNWATAATSTA